MRSIRRTVPEKDSRPLFAFGAPEVTQHTAKYPHLLSGTLLVAEKDLDELNVAVDHPAEFPDPVDQEPTPPLPLPAIAEPDGILYSRVL